MSPPPHTLAGSICPLQPLPLNIFQPLLFNEGKQRKRGIVKWNIYNEDVLQPLWQLQGSGSMVTWHCWAKSPKVLQRLSPYSIVIYIIYIFYTCIDWPWVMVLSGKIVRRIENLKSWHNAGIWKSILGIIFAKVSSLTSLLSKLKLFLSLKM